MKCVLCILLLVAVYRTKTGYVASQQCEASSVGPNFVFGLIGYHARVTSNNIHLHITPVLPVPAHVRVTAPFINMDRIFVVSNYAVIPLNGTLIQFENGTQFKGIEVSSDVNISLAVFSADGNDLTEGFLVLPVSTLDTRYIAASYIPYGTYSSEILIAGVETDTDVILSTVIDGKMSSNLTFRLQKFETYQFKVNNDVSGSIVTSSKPVAIFSGSALAHVPVGIGDVQYLVEQMIPTKYWTSKFIVPPIYPRKHFVVKLFADQDNMEVHYYNRTNHFALNMNKSGLVELLFSTDPVTVLADKPISVIQYGHDGDNMVGDPFMSTTQGIAQFQNSYKFVTQNYHFAGSNTITITILKNSTSGLLLNGHSMSYWSAKYVSVSPPLDQYVILFVNVSYNIYYHLYHSNGIKFGAVIYGRIYNSVAYGYPLQLLFYDRDCGSHTGSLTTTHVHTTTTMSTHTTSQGGGTGKWCFHCDGMSHLQLCDRVQRCHTENEVCYVQSYTRSLDVSLYRSGCISPQQCINGDGNGGCLQCCNDSFCNSEGCGDKGFQPLGQRGPLCFDCTHAFDNEACNTLQLCDTNQVCMIEKYKWGSSNFHNIMGCTHSQVCTSKRSIRDLTARHAPVCSHCCHTDFCNMNCTTLDTGIAIIG